MGEFTNPTHPESNKQQETLEKKRKDCLDWLEKREIDSSSVPIIDMNQREFDLFRNFPTNPKEYGDYIRKIYEIPSGDQQDCRYIIAIISPIGSSLPAKLELVDVTEIDFGTTIDIQKDEINFSPVNPDLNPGEVATDNIAEELNDARESLNIFVEKLMKGQTLDPFNREKGDIGIRAGDIFDGQKDAYIWKDSVIASSVILTINFPWHYRCIAVVRGREVKPGNGKDGMAQILNPEVVMKIEGEDLVELQEIYKMLYKVPNYALTEDQRNQRDSLFNYSLVKLISAKAHSNKRIQDDEIHQTRRKRTNNTNRRYLN
jgi:hypothetical protein